GWTFQYGVNQPHGWSPYTTAQLITIMAQYMADQAPPGVATDTWFGARAQSSARHATVQSTVRAGVRTP
ncbi:MAG TPA: hypothetical protein VK576_05095, partial [Thermoleophilia bacterium]|nr:hypothetical protein [Thermoleophilia bacterium]